MSNYGPQVDLEPMERIRTSEGLGGSTPKKTPSPQEWANQRQTIVFLFIMRDLTLSEVKQQMDKLGFFATKRMYKSRLASWNVGKNASRKDYLVLARLFAERQSRGLPEGTFEVHNKIRNIEDLRKYLRQHGENEEAFFAEARANSAPIPAHVHHVQQDHRLPASAPGIGPTFQEVEMVESQSAHMLAASQSFTEPGDGRSSPPDSGRDPASPFGHDGSNPEAFDVAETAKSVTDRPGPAIQPVYAEDYLEAQHIGDSLRLATLPHNTYSHNNSSHGKSQMEQTTNTAIFSELSDLSTWHSLVNMSKKSTRFDASSYAKTSLPFVDEPQADSACTDGSSMSPICPEESDVPQGMRQRDDLSIFMPACMLACTYEAARKNDIKALCLDQAKSAFRRLCIVGSPFVLTSAITMLTWMLVHVQSSFTDDVMWSVHCVASDVLGNGDPISVLLRWMFLAAATKLAQSPINSSELRRIRLALQKGYGDTHRHSIVATYCLAFHLMIVDRLDNANALAEAVGHLCHIETIARSVLGASDLMTINIMSTLSRAYSRMEDFPAALAAINRSLQAEPLGANHPHRLEIIVRKAILCRKMGRLEQAEELYWIALSGRIATLGQEHRSTNKAHDSLVVVLKERGRWDWMKGEVHRLVVDPHVAVTEYESWWRRVVEANTDSGGFRESSEETS